MKHFYRIEVIILFVGIVLLFSGCKKEDNQVVNGDNVIEIPKSFSVSPDNQVFFSKGNLQYQASTNTWRFASNQWEVIGYENSNISESYDGWIDLFGWGTSGHNHGATCFQPWSTNNHYTDYYAYGDSTCHLYNQTGEADWGHNIISNVESQTSHWRTLTKEEWEYLFYFRTTRSGIRYAKANVDEVNGVLLLPDDWDEAYFSLNNTNLYNASFSSNNISQDDWLNVFERNGAVFLTITGFRYGIVLHNVNEFGCYWSASVRNDYSFESAYFVLFDDLRLYAYDDILHVYGDRCLGMSVRLVCKAE